MGESNLAIFLDAMCWTMFAACIVWGAIAGWCYHKHMYSMVLLRMLLHILYRMHQRGVYISPPDMATINVAIDHVMKKTNVTARVTLRSRETVAAPTARPAPYCAVEDHHHG